MIKKTLAGMIFALGTMTPLYAQDNFVQEKQKEQNTHTEQEHSYLSQAQRDLDKYAADNYLDVTEQEHINASYNNALNELHKNNPGATRDKPTQERHDLFKKNLNGFDFFTPDLEDLLRKEDKYKEVRVESNFSAYEQLSLYGPLALALGFAGYFGIRKLWKLFKRQNAIAPVAPAGPQNPQVVLNNPQIYIDLRRTI